MNPPATTVPAAAAAAVVLRATDWQLYFPYTPENLPRIVAMQEIMRSWPAERRATTAWEKGMMRLEDARRIAAGEATPEQVQQENSFLPSAVLRTAKITFDPIAFQAECQALLQRLQEEECNETSPTATVTARAQP